MQLSKQPSTLGHSPDTETDLIFRIFTYAAKLKASDIHLHADARPAFRVDGKLYIIEDEQVISAMDLQSILDNILNPSQQEKFRLELQVDTAVEYPDLGVLRMHIYRKRGNIAMALRLVRSKILTFGELGLPDIIRKFSNLQRGLVLISGATSNGKSTTLATILEDINKRFAKHVLTIEDPIEFLFENKRSIFSQRDIGIDTISFGSAIVGAMREDPDVIMLSDLRDNETIENALIAAETGHLVFGTTHAPTAPDSITRIISTFPAEKQDTIRVKMAQNLRAVLAQRLIPAKSGVGRIPAVEYMIISSRIRELILDPMKIGDISQLVHGEQIVKGVLAFDNHITQLYKEDKISQKTALDFATSRTDMKLRLSGMLK